MRPSKSRIFVKTKMLERTGLIQVFIVEISEKQTSKEQRDIGKTKTFKEQGHRKTQAR